MFLGKSTSSILVDDTKNESSDSKKVQELEKQLEGMKAMMETLLKSNNEIENLPIAEDMKNTQVKKAGRPKKID